MEYYYVMKKKRNFAIYSNMDKLGRLYAKWNKSDRKKMNTVWYHWYMGSKTYNKLVNKTEKGRLTGIGNKLVVASVGEAQITEYKIGLGLHCAAQWIQPVIYNNCKWKVTFKNSIKIKK